MARHDVYVLLPLASGSDCRPCTMTMMATPKRNNNYKRRRRSVSLLLACVLLSARCCLAFRPPTSRHHATVPGLRMRNGGDLEPSRRPLANSTNFNRLDNTFLRTRTIRTRSSASPPLPRGFTYDDEDPEVDGTIISDNNSAYAPEVNRWATLVADGTNAAIMKQDYDPEEGMEILYNNLRELGPDDDVEVEGYWDQLLPTGECYSIG